MSVPSRMPRYDVRNDGMGPYAVFYCETCDREFRSQPDLKNTVTTDIGRKAAGNLLRKVPLFGGALADNVAGEDPRYSVSLSAEQLQAHWNQVKDRFRECPTCKKVVCISDFDEQSGYCNEDSPRVNEITEARAEQAGAVFKGLANAFGLGDQLKQAGEAARQSAQRASASMARCPKDGTLAAPGTKFCPECGSPMTQPAATICPKCGADTHGARFCPNCGNKMEAAPAGVCPSCGAKTGTAKFCPECGAKLA
jgi:ribosomal protein L32